MIWERKLAKIESEALKISGKKLVFTNGCFDILHRGHVEYLQKARLLGDFLIVGLNSDSSVSKLKGSLRPLQTERDRAIILNALSAVDAVVVFEEATPHELIIEIQPHVLAKGGDYKNQEIAGSKTVLSNGGRVEILPLISGISTSTLIEKLQEKPLPKKHHNS